MYWITVHLTTAQQPHFQTALLFYLVAVLFELLSEPAYTHLILAGDTCCRVRVEGTAVRSHHQDQSQRIRSLVRTNAVDR